MWLNLFIIQVIVPYSTHQGKKYIYAHIQNMDITWDSLWRYSYINSNFLFLYTSLSLTHVSCTRVYAIFLDDSNEYDS